MKSWQGWRFVVAITSQGKQRQGLSRWTVQRRRYAQACTSAPCDCCSMYDVFPIWLVWKSWRLMAWTAWALRWCWRRRISKAPLDENERAYLTRRALRVPEVTVGQLGSAAQRCSLLNSGRVCCVHVCALSTQYMWEEKEDEERKELLKQYVHAAHQRRREPATSSVVCAWVYGWCTGSCGSQEIWKSTHQSRCAAK